MIITLIRSSLRMIANHAGSLQSLDFAPTSLSHALRRGLYIGIYPNFRTRSSGFSLANIRRASSASSPTFRPVAPNTRGMRNSRAADAPLRVRIFGFSLLWKDRCRRAKPPLRSLESSTQAAEARLDPNSTSARDAMRVRDGSFRPHNVLCGP